MDLSRKIARLGRARSPGVSSATSVAVLEPAVPDGAGWAAEVGPGLADAAPDLSRDGPAGGAFRLEAPARRADPRERVRQARIHHLRNLIADFEVRAQTRADKARAEREATWAEAGGPPELPGERRETPDGPIRVAEHHLPPEHCHGDVAVQRGLQSQPEVLARLAFDATLGGVDPSGALFLDTETTGLTGGTGTIPFLLGIAYFEQGALKLEQLFLESPGEEAPMLERLREALERCSVLVTYNGKSYDWPLLSTRFVLNRVKPPAPRPHLDLLHIARRLFRLRLGSARLVTMEEQVLGMRRERDIDGAEIPGVYWSYLRHRDPTQVARVMEHNANDLVALAALMGVVSERYAELHVADDPRDHLCLARTAVRADDIDKALNFARAAAEGGGAPEISVQAGLLLGELRRKAKDFEGAVRALEDAVEAAESDVALAAPAHLALAKLHEHRTKDLARALIHARFTGPEEGEPERDHRVARLERRIERRAEQAARAARGRRRRKRRTETSVLAASVMTARAGG